VFLSTRSSGPIDWSVLESSSVAEFVTDGFGYFAFCFHSVSLVSLRCLTAMFALTSRTFWRQGPSACPRFRYLQSLNGKTIPIQAWTGPYGSRGLRLPEFLDSRHIKVARLSVLCTGRLYLQEIPLVLICVQGCVEPRAIVRPEGSSQREIQIQPVTFRLVAQCLNQPRHCVLQSLNGFFFNKTFSMLYGITI
jgi:hypothetical protein